MACTLVTCYFDYDRFGASAIAFAFAFAGAGAGTRSGVGPGFGDGGNTSRDGSSSDGRFVVCAWGWFGSYGCIAVLGLLVVWCYKQRANQFWIAWLPKGGGEILSDWRCRE